MQLVIERPPQLKGFRDKYWAAMMLAPYMVDAARAAAQNEGDNYRDFKVGAAALGLSTHRVGIFAAANFYPVQDGPKVCAEQPALTSLRNAQFKKLIFNVVSAKPQTDSGGLELPHLPHCDGCMRMMGSAKEVSGDTVSMLMHADRDEYGLYSFDELRRLKASVDAEDAPEFFDHHIDPGFTVWRRGAAAYRRHIEQGAEPGSPFDGIGPGPELFRLAVSGALDSYSNN